MLRSIIKRGDRLNDNLVFHDGSGLTSEVSIYFGVDNKAKKRIAVAKAGSKSGICSVSRSM